jgi:hypothetical protein
MGEADGQFSPESSSAKGEDLSFQGVLDEIEALTATNLPPKNLSFHSVEKELNDKAQEQLQVSTIEQSESIDNQQKITEQIQRVADKITEGIHFLDQVAVSTDPNLDRYKPEADRARQSLIRYRSTFAEILQKPTWIEASPEQKIAALEKAFMKVSTFIDNLPNRF